MRSNPRLFIRSLQSLIFENNPIIFIFIQLKKILNNSTEFPQKHKKIFKSIQENKTRLEKAKSLIDLNSRNTAKTINLVR
ncbi:MAG: hypothetical protein A2287_06425 [Candidatus Melainabacteria bacterium RIFOXYA12_FULL_32_12]|nr:MAG: hypothetical protein A2255_06905 [Candidatus Melainabacteria bacterium RIFOXYA2_FULL_32_9]OGI31583.1 MAG: hypothetical protein A2287_06425 [Candidatus Melainabacteria bacterium RIFOXYA12_FULL_32_12]